MCLVWNLKVLLDHHFQGTRLETHHLYRPEVFTSSLSAPWSQQSTIRLPYTAPAAKGQTIHVTEDIHVLASANNSWPLGNKSGETLPGRSSGYGPWQHHSPLSGCCVYLHRRRHRCTYTSVFLFRLPLRGQGETVAKS